MPPPVPEWPERAALNEAYREGRARVFADLLQALAIMAPHYDGRGQELHGVRERLEALAEEVNGVEEVAK